MNIVLTLILAILLAAGLGIAVALAINGVGFALRLPKRRCPVSIDSLVSIVSITLIVLAYAVLPWPLNPAGASAWVGQPALVWVLVEGAFLVSAFAGLLAPSPSAARAALREAQVNVAGRLALWVVVGSSLWSGVGWSALEVLGRAFLFLVGVVVVAASAGLGPFAPDTSLAPSGAEEGLGTDERWLAQMARQMRAGLVLALFVVGILPGSDVVQPQIAAIIAPALLAVLLAGLRQARRTLPLAPLHTTVHWCLWRALPVALIGSVYLHLMAR